MLIRVWTAPGAYAGFVCAALVPLAAWRVAALGATTDLLPLPLEPSEARVVAALGVLLALTALASLARHVRVEVDGDVATVRSWPPFPGGRERALPLDALADARVEPLPGSEQHRLVARVEGRDVTVVEAPVERLLRALDELRAQRRGRGATAGTSGTASGPGGRLGGASAGEKLNG